MIGNNACGSRALGYGRTADNVVALRALTADGADVASLHAVLDALGRPRTSALIRTEFGRFSRQVSGYSLEHLLPENGRSVDRFLVGSEGTLAVVAGPPSGWSRTQPHRVLVVLGFPSMADAADAVPRLLEHDLVACEGWTTASSRLVPRRIPELPRGKGWLLARGHGRHRGRGGAGRGGARTRRAERGRRPTSPSSARSGGSARTAPASPRARRTRPARPAGRTPRFHRSGSAPTCATSTPSLTQHGSTACPTATSATAASTSGSTSPSTTREAGPATGAFVEEAARLAASHGGVALGRARRRPGPLRAAAAPCTRPRRSR